MLESILKLETLNFIVNGEEVSIRGLDEKEVNQKWFEKVVQYGNEKNSNYDEFCYRICVQKAIEKVLNIKDLQVTNQSAQIAWEAYDDGDFIGNFVVYSDYISMHSFDRGDYNRIKNLKEIA